MSLLIVSPISLSSHNINHQFPYIGISLVLYAPSNQNRACIYQLQTISKSPQRIKLIGLHSFSRYSTSSPSYNRTLPHLHPSSPDQDTALFFKKPIRTTKRLTITGGPQSQSTFQWFRNHLLSRTSLASYLFIRTLSMKTRNVMNRCIKPASLLPIKRTQNTIYN